MKMSSDKAKKLNTEVPRINSKKFKEIEIIIEKARKLMIEQFGLNLNIKIDNKMNHSWNGYLKILEIDMNKGIVTKFGNVYIKTSGRSLRAILKTIAHEFSHITYTFCHISKCNIPKNIDVNSQNNNHSILTMKMFELIMDNVENWL